jgi:H+/Cl- antiporter ClcA
MREGAAQSVDVGSVIQSKDYGALLVLSGGIGPLVALAAWCFLTVIPWIQNEVFTDIPSASGFDSPPWWWWPIPILTLAGLIGTRRRTSEAE